MKTSTTTLFAVIVAILAVTSAIYVAYQMNILTNNYNALQNSHTALTNDHNALQTNYNTLLSEKTTLQTQVNGLNSQLTTLNNSYNSLQNNYTVLMDLYNECESNSYGQASFVIDATNHTGAYIRNTGTVAVCPLRVYVNNQLMTAYTISGNWAPGTISTINFDTAYLSIGLNTIKIVFSDNTPFEFSIVKNAV